MKLNEILSKPNGTFVGARFTDKTKNQLRKYLYDNNIPNPINPNEVHTTIIYSRKDLPTFTPRGMFANPYLGTPTNFELFTSKPDMFKSYSSNALVLRFDSPELTKRHNEIRNNFGATHDYDEYKPHITLSYDAGDFDIDSIPMYDKPLEVNEEYSQDLQIDWNKK